MSDPRTRQPDLLDALNERFARIAGWSFDHRWIVLAASLVAVAGALVASGGARVDSSYEAYFDPSDTTFLAYESYREDFGSDEITYLMYEAPGTEHGVWNLEVMRQIERLTSAIEDEVPFLYDVKSLTNAEIVRGTPDGIEIAELGDDFPQTQAEMLAWRDEVMAKPMLVGGVVSPDGTHGALILEMDRSSTDPLDQIRLDPDAGDGLDNLYPQATDDATAAILARPEYAGLRFYTSGDVPLNAVYNRVIAEESGFLFAVTLAVVGVILAACFRSVVGVLAPLAVVSLAVVFCMALIALLGWKIDMSFGSAPTLLTAIGVANSVHILSEFRARFRKLGDRREALVRSIYLVGTPCLLTSLTTAAGFAAMSFVPIKSIAHMGVYNAFGVLCGFALSLTLLMALLSFGRRTREPVDEVADGRRSLAALAAIADFDVRHRRAILAVFAALFVASGIGMTRLIVDSNWLDDFSDAIPLKADTEYVDEVMGGTANLVYVFDAGDDDAIKEPGALREIERVQRVAEEHDLVRKSYSIVDVLKDLNQAFHAGNPSWHVIPESRELVAQYLLLYEASGGEEAGKHVTPDYRRAGLELRLALEPTSETADLVAAVDAALAEQPLEHTSVSLTGIGALWLKLLDYIVSSQIQGFLLAFVAIAGMIVGIFRSLATGALAMVPNLAPIALILGAIGFAGVYLDYSKITVASVAIGIAVDDTIHLITRYRHAFARLRDYEAALREALCDVGRALCITSLALVCGFLVFLLSVLDASAVYGVLLAATIVVALVADFFLMPALVLTFRPWGPEGERASVQTLKEAA